MAQYAEIVEIVAPAKAVTGSLVDVTVGNKNVSSIPVGIMAVGVPEYPDLPPATYINGLSPHEAVANVSAGATRSFSGYFTMPSANVTIHIYSYYFGVDDLWHLDEEKTKDVKLTELVPAFSEFKITDYRKV
jgi:hypothetical protein